MEPRVFPSSIHWATGMLLSVVSVLMVVLPLYALAFEDLSFWNVIISMIFLAVGFLFYWILKDTKYTFTEDTLHYCCGPFRGKINVADIRAIEHQEGFYCYSLVKPALGFNGLYIHYNSFDDVYISPKDKEGFVNYLLTTNPKILIKGNKTA